MLKIGVVGASGLVGTKTLDLLFGEYKVKNAEYYLFGSSSVGKEVYGHTVLDINEEILNELKLDYCLFMAGSDVSAKWAPVIAKNGGIAIDNSSGFRMNKDVPLVVPEVNMHHVGSMKNGGIIANPNCSTIQVVMALKPLHDAYKLKMINYTTYQAVSGAGKGGTDDYDRGQKGEKNLHFPYPIFGNLIPQIDEFTDNGYTKEEMKMINETNKIFGTSLPITATCVRVPIKNCHSISITAQFEKAPDIVEAKKLLAKADGIVVFDDVSKKVYPMPIHADDKDSVYVGRIRKDLSMPNAISMFCVADNLRKGAATNAIQILHALIKRGK